MNRLSDVTEDMAIKLLGEVEFGQHLQGTKFHSMSGGLPVIFTELQEANDFIHVGTLRSLLILGGGGTVHYLDFHKLKTWLSDVFNDQELANAIGLEIEKGRSYVETMGPIKELIEERLKQCRSLLQQI